MNFRRKKLVRLLWGALFLSAMSNACLAESETQNTYSNAELKAAYDAMPPEDQNYINTLSPEERKKLLEVRVEYEAQTLPEEQAVPTEPFIIDTRKKLYELDPLLKEAYWACMDQTVPRDKVIALFQKYIDKEPNSIFLPEIYFRIGSLYSTNRRRDLGETRSIEKTSEYYKKAHELYGDKFSDMHRTAWATLTNYTNSTIEARIACYAWLQKLSQNISGEDIYPVRLVGHADMGFVPTWTDEEREKVAETIRKTESIPRAMKVAETNILWRSSFCQADLVKLAEAFSDTELGRRASIRLHELQSGRLLETDMISEPQTPKDQTNGAILTPAAEELDGPEETVLQKEPLVPAASVVGDMNNRQNARGKWLVLALVVVLTIGAGSSAAVYRRRQRR